jgi:hypothetical protein
MADFDKLSKFVLDYLSEYLWMLRITLTKPAILFQPIVVSRENSIALNSNERVYKIARIHPKIIMFFLVSIFMGLTINRFVPGIGSLPDIYACFFISTLGCVFFGSVYYVFCRLLGGKGSLEQTISLCLQIASALYLLNSFASFMASIVVIPALDHYLLANYNQHISLNPMAFFFLFQYVLAAMYTPFALHRVHRFKRWVFIVLIFIFLLIVLPSRTYVDVKIWQETGMPGGSGGGGGG